MIVTEFYKAQGFGNQLWSYVVTRVIARDRGYDFGVMHPENWKGLSSPQFKNMSFGLPVIGGSGPQGGPPKTLPEGIKYYYQEKKLFHPLTGADINIPDPDLPKIPDNTKLDGVMQDENFILHRKEEIREWLRIPPELECLDYASDDICIIKYRGGEFLGHPDLLLKDKYWEDAVANMKKINPNFRFVVVTDDVKAAKKVFPDLEIVSRSIGEDYSIIKNAKYLILANSSFIWFPVWLNENLKFCIAPKYWGRHNISEGYWSPTYSLTRGLTYQDRDGKLSTYDECKVELDKFMEEHKEWYARPKVDRIPLNISDYTDKQIKISNVKDSRSLKDILTMSDDPLVIARGLARKYLPQWARKPLYTIARLLGTEKKRP